MRTREEPRPPFPEQHQEKPGEESELRPRPRYKAPGYRGSDKLKNKVAFITGADSGIGRAVAVLFAREGAQVALGYIPEAEQADAEETRAAVEEEGSRAILVPGDVADPNYAQKALTSTIEAFDRIDILVNNAAYQQHVSGPEELSNEQWELTFRTNIFGYFYMVKAALRYLKRGGVIINTGSITGLEGSPQLLDYSSTKGAIHAFTKSLAQNLVDRGIRVNAVSPGPVRTPLNPSDVSADEVSEFGSHVPYGRPAQPEEIAPAYVFFASEADSSYITGEVLTLLGGKTTAG